MNITKRRIHNEYSRLLLDLKSLKKDRNIVVHGDELLYLELDIESVNIDIDEILQNNSFLLEI